MSNTQAIDQITRLKNRYLLFRWIEIALMVIGVFLLMWSLISLVSYSILLKIVVSMGVGLTIAAWKVAQYKLRHFNNQIFIRYLNSRYPQLEESADLILKSVESLSRLQQLQLQKTISHFDSIYPEIKIPNALPRTIGLFILCAATSFILTAFVSPWSFSKNKNTIIDLDKVNVKIEKGAAIVTSLSIIVTPPFYTSIKSSQSTSPDVKVPEGSKLTWQIGFSDSVSSPKLFLSGKDSVLLVSIQNQYQANLNVTSSGFYQIGWNKNSRSDYFKIEVINDQPPKITINNLNQFTKLSFTNAIKIPAQSTITDEYGLTNAIIIATVSKGSGESVKFREEKLEFEKPTTISGKTVKASLTLDLKKLGMEAGDELYFYVQAIDNKTPLPNYSRTETFFIALQDTTKQVLVEDDGLGVDLMPEYFRSQRQIIIDTEKLLREKKKIALQQFKSTSNELGYDQKVLRLRYGQFLGEEFEGQIGKAAVGYDHDKEENEDITKQFGHAHDKENEHNLVPDKKTAPTGHSHGDEHKEDAKENPLEAFAHNHDDGEQATFFVQSVRAKLKAALTVMWDAELYLRLYEPEKSLPYQYTALKLLKEISNDSRIYVHRTGFDPPPIKEEKRLTANLEEVRNSTGRTEQSLSKRYPEIRKTVVLIDELLSHSEIITSDKQQLHKAGQELATIAIEQSGKYLDGLSLIKRITDEKLKIEELHQALEKIKIILWKVLPEESASPTKSELTTHELDQQFLKSLNKLNHD
jgi:hypothetical protein